MRKSKTTPVKAPLRLNIASGQVRMEGWTNIDISKEAKPDIVHDLMKFPWPIKTESVDEALVSHYIEHIPRRAFGDPGPDPLFMFFDELWRILIPEGKARIIAPYYASYRCDQDPTHTRGINEFTFAYFNRDWRVQNKLDHYPLSCHFSFGYSYIFDAQWMNKVEEARNFAFKHYLNTINDIQVDMVKQSITTSSLNSDPNGPHANANQSQNGHQRARRGLQTPNPALK